MSVIEVKGDIFESGMQSLVCPVNCVGAMGAGLALDFRKRVPGLYERYQEYAFAKKLKIDRLWRFPWEGTGKQVIGFPSKYHWKMSSNKDHVIANLYRLVSLREKMQITSLAIPPVGCGLGGLSYENDLREPMHDVLSVMGIEVRIMVP